MQNFEVRNKNCWASSVGDSLFANILGLFILTLAMPVTRWYKPSGMGLQTTVAGRLWGFRW